MLDLKWIRENNELFDKLMSSRGAKPVSNEILKLDEKRRQFVTLIQALQESRNKKNAQIQKFGNVQSEELKALKRDAAHIRDKLSQLEQKLDAHDQLDDFLATLPNIPDTDVPVGSSEADNICIKTWGDIPKFDFQVKSHLEIGEKLGLIDTEQTGKISGSRFVTLKSGLARMERALANYMLDFHHKNYNFIEISPPLLVKDSAMFNSGQLPKFADESFKVEEKFRLIPTSEVPLVNLVADKIIEPHNLPLRFTAYTPCFRSEAGAAGKDTKGMIRLHQFSKVELVSITNQEEAETEHQLILKIAEEILENLKLPYRTMLLCTGDMGFHAKKTYDLEVWLPSQNKYREISSCSNCGDFQARRLKARYISNIVNKEKKYVYTLNGSALAIGRTIVAILENYQLKDGSVRIPDVLKPYMQNQDFL